MKQTDVPAAFRLSEQAGWNQTERDWERLIELTPDGCFGIDCDERLAATTTLLCYGERLAWLGMVLTDRDHRRKGLARALVTAALAYAEREGIQTIKLDATEQGQPLYESLGWRPESAIERWSRSAIEPATRSSFRDASWDLAAGLDQEAFGADRSRLLASFQDRGKLYDRDSGFALTRPGSRATYIGPLVADNSNTARELLKICLPDCAGPCFLDLLPENKHSVTLAQEGWVSQGPGVGSDVSRTGLPSTGFYDLRDCRIRIWIIRQIRIPSAIPSRIRNKFG